MTTKEALEIDVETFAARLRTGFSSDGDFGGDFSGDFGGDPGFGSAFVMDVRSAAEYMAGHVPGAVHVPLASVLHRIADLPRDRTVFVICAAGTRSLEVAKTLAVVGIDALSVAGGTTAWIRARRPVSIGRSAA